VARGTVGFDAVGDIGFQFGLLRSIGCVEIYGRNIFVVSDMLLEMIGNDELRSSRRVLCSVSLRALLLLSLVLFSQPQCAGCLGSNLSGSSGTPL
jgi:hypothetical protein